LQFFPLMVRAVNKPTVESLASRLDQLERSLAFAFLTAKGIMARYGWSERTFYYRAKQPGFPRPKRFPGHLWTVADVLAAEAAGQLPCPSAGQ
jgi:predicted DNA-binding transcriptional regulator AlpA